MMDKNKILHIMVSEKFMAPYIDFVDKHFGRKDHHYVFITSEKYEYGLTKEHNVEFLHTDNDIFIMLLEYMKNAKKIILHGLWRDKVNQLLVDNKELFKKSYWIMWGGDFFPAENRNENHREVIKNVGYLVTGTVGDYELAQEWYGATGKHIFGVINYPSNLYKEVKPLKKQKNMVYIQVGNSADPSNQHFKVFQYLRKYKDKNIKIFVPLSYGDQENKRKVVLQGKRMFGNKFIPITNFMQLDEYHRFLSQIDIAIFNHVRQQGAGNTYTLLACGAKVYMNQVSNLYKTLAKYNIKMYDVKKVNLSAYQQKVKEYNKKIAKENFSENALVKTIGLYIVDQ